jgi:hypothetical protein
MALAPNDPPQEVHALATWFAAAVRLELTELEKKGGDRRYELLSGRRVTAENSLCIIYRFTLAESTLVPEDASGTLEIQGRQIKAKVNAQETNQIDVEIDGANEFGPFVSRAILCIDDLGLLRRLA